MSEILLDAGMRGDVIHKPGEEHIARRGARRFVKLVPLPGNYAAPAIWTGQPHEDTIDGQKMLVRTCVVLMVKEPAPETMRITIPADFYEKLPDVPVEW